MVVYKKFINTLHYQTFSLSRVFTHEIGHILGLSDLAPIKQLCLIFSDVPSIMNYLPTFHALISKMPSQWFPKGPTSLDKAAVQALIDRRGVNNALLAALPIIIPCFSTVTYPYLLLLASAATLLTVFAARNLTTLLDKIEDAVYPDKKEGPLRELNIDYEISKMTSRMLIRGFVYWPWVLLYDIYKGMFEAYDAVVHREKSQSNSLFSKTTMYCKAYFMGAVGALKLSTIYLLNPILPTVCDFARSLYQKPKVSTAFNFFVQNIPGGDITLHNLNRQALLLEAHYSDDIDGDQRARTQVVSL